MAEKPTLAVFQSYLKTIENSVGSNMFRNVFVRKDDELVDVADDGTLSCAVYVSSVLRIFGLIKEPHATIASTLTDMEESGWHEITEPRPGAVVFWDYDTLADGTRSQNRHLGFYIDSQTAVSNSTKSGSVARHHPTYGTLANGNARRAVLAYYWHDKLNSN